jgi:hypothetical protein
MSSSAFPCPRGGEMGLVAVSTGALPRLLDRPYWEAEAALEVALSLGGPPLELVLLPEWDPSGPPVTPYYCDWEESRGRDPEGRSPGWSESRVSR